MKTNRTLAILLTLVMVAAAVCIGLSGKPAERSSCLYVTDTADVLSFSAEEQLLAMQQSQSARLSILTVSSTGRASTADYTEQIWNDWQMGSSDLLLVLVTGSKKDYYFGYDTGSWVADRLDSSYDTLLMRDLEPDFAAGDYSAAALSFAQAVRDTLSGQSQLLQGDLWGDGDSWDSYSWGEEIVNETSDYSGVILLVVIIIVLILLSKRNRRKQGYSSGSAYHSSPNVFFFNNVGNNYRPGSSYRPGNSATHSTHRPSGFGGGGRPGGGFGGGGRSGGRSGGFGGGGRSGGGRSGGFGGGGRR